MAREETKIDLFPPLLVQSYLCYCLIPAELLSVFLLFCWGLLLPISYSKTWDSFVTKTQQMLCFLLLGQLQQRRLNPEPPLLLSTRLSQVFCVRFPEKVVGSNITCSDTQSNATQLHSLCPEGNSYSHGYAGPS